MDIIINGVIWTELGIYVGPEVLSAVVVKSPVFWDIKARSLLTGPKNKPNKKPA
jgi:hypothetical protein